MRDAIAKALTRAGGREPLPGLPTKPQTVEGELFVPGPFGKAHDVAEQYMAGSGLKFVPPKQYAPLDKDNAKRIAEAFDALPLYDPKALSSYDKMIRETLGQYQAIKNTGLDIKPVDLSTYPYGGNPRAVARDVADNNRMAFFKTGEGFGTGTSEKNPLLRQSGEYIGDYPMLNNDLFRVVHDYFGHIKGGYGFRAGGEDNAWRAHGRMYSPEALPAMTSETRGQNSWVNSGPHADFNRTASGADTIYAPQKIALMPSWTWGDLGKYAIPGAMGAAAALDQYGSGAP